MESTSDEKPILFFTALPGEGHTYPLLNIASAMIKRGYEVVFHGGAQFEASIVKMGAEFSPVPGLLDHVGDPESVPVESDAIKDRRLGLLVFGLTKFLYESMVSRTEAMEAALVKVREDKPNRQVIIVHELCSMNVTPFRFGRPLPRGFDAFPRTIGIGAVSISSTSIDTAPFSMGLPFDTSPACTLRNKELHRLANEGPWQPLFKCARQVMEKSGCTKVPDENPLDLWYSTPDICFQMCSPSMEYPLSDMPPKLHFAGCLPPRAADPDFATPDWWGEVVQSTSNENRRKIIFVSQGTAHVDYSQLIIPTMEAFRGRDDVLVIATLGIRGAALGSDVQVPENVRWIDFLPYDLILPHVDVFICNSGYGSSSHAVTNGVPAVLSGDELDKKEVTMRAAYAGYAWDLESATPSVEQIRAGVEAVLGNDKFRQRAMELKKENEAMNCMDTIENQIIKFSV